MSRMEGKTHAEIAAELGVSGSLVEKYAGTIE
jgi:DNA-binding CsgD family transcriptional regulator